MDIVEFLAARIAEDQDMTRSGLRRGARMGPLLDGVVARTDTDGLEEVLEAYPPPPAEVRDLILAECEVKRQLLEAFSRASAASRDRPPGAGPDERALGHREGLLEACRILASTYADHPDYRAGWPS